MMPQNSSISASRFIRYLVFIPLCTGLVIAAYLGLILHNIKNEVKMPQEELYDFQITKLKNAEKLDVLFLGDSSLGNLINAKLWEELSGRKTINLALTAGYGYEGAYVMLLNALGLGKKPKIAFIFFEPNQITGSITYQAFLQKNPVVLNENVSLIEIAKLYWLTYFNKQAIIFNIKKPWFNMESLKGNIEFENDYMKQAQVDNSPGRFGDVTYSKNLSNINPRKVSYLKKISNICNENNIKCVYVYGPNVDVLCKKQAELMKFQNEYIKSVGLIVASENQQCPKPEEMGDSANHIHPRFKEKYTKVYFELLKNFL